ncbi:NACHT domain-containing protein [Acrocarpospora phusangensis]|uniref:NACHT domain-containing protein n=1 Tax=Acrocarpospora phusangensis TaxID=1070424 RepID=UPI00194FD34A|nr:NACHT domain-containing protein [Acrocarpospora phusangensis]
MNRRRGVRIAGGALALLAVPIGVAVNQVLDGGEWNWRWLALAAGLVLLTWALDQVLRLLEERPAETGPERHRAKTVRGARFARSYAKYVLSVLRFVDQKGLPTVGDNTPELDKVFVDVGLERRPPHQVSAHPLARQADGSERRSISSFIGRKEPAIIAVTGAPGSGKTTLLRHTARRVAAATGRKRWGRPVPILLYLRDHVPEMTAPDQELPSVVRGTLEGLAAKEPASWFEERLEAGDCVVLLDGLDEVADERDRQQVASWVERQIARYPENDFVITSRPRGYQGPARIQGATVLEVQPFSADQVSVFVHGWYQAIERLSTGTEGEDVERLAARGADGLLRKLEDNPELQALSVNPLLLTMVASVHRFLGALPGTRAALYRDICQVMLWRRREAKQLPGILRGAHAEAPMREVAYEMMRRKVTALSEAEILAVIAPSLTRFPGEVTAEAFLQDVVSGGLLIEQDVRKVGFAHLTFQEYLAAAYIQEERLGAQLVNHVTDPWWHEVTVLYAAGADADDIVRACLMAGEVNALTLAFDCVELGGPLDPDLRRHLYELLESGSGDPELDRRVALAAILRAVRIFGPTEERGGLSVIPISNALYQMFLRTEPDEDAHGTPAPDLESPVLGVRGWSAERFVAWANALGPGSAFRLPRPEEIDPSVVRVAFNGAVSEIWVRPAESAGEHPLLWTPAGTRAPLMENPGRDDPETMLLIYRILLLLLARNYQQRLGESLAAAKPFNPGDVLSWCQEMNKAFQEFATRTRSVSANPWLGQCLLAGGVVAEILPNHQGASFRRRTDALDLIVDIEKALDTAFEEFHAHESGLPVRLGLDGNLRYNQLGDVLTRSFSKARGRPEYLLREFGDAGHPAQLPPSPDQLKDQLLEIHRLAGDESRPWLTTLLNSLREFIVPLVLGRIDPTPAHVTEARVIVNCLTDAVGRQSILRTAVAYLSWLEQRKHGQKSPAESILLVREI